MQYQDAVEEATETVDEIRLHQLQDIKEVMNMPGLSNDEKVHLIEATFILSRASEKQVFDEFDLVAIPCGCGNCGTLVLPKDVYEAQQNQPMSSETISDEALDFDPDEQQEENAQADMPFGFPFMNMTGLPEMPDHVKEALEGFLGANGMPDLTVITGGLAGDSDKEPNLQEMLSGLGAVMPVIAPMMGMMEPFLKQMAENQAKSNDKSTN